MSDVRVVVSKRNTASTVIVTPEEVPLELVCPACQKAKQEDQMHFCTYCVGCCDCRVCRACGNLLVLEACTACGLCRDCCRCYACRRCRTPHTHRSQLCTLCGNGLRERGCGCCQHGRGSEGRSIEHFRIDVNLARYKATSDEHTKKNQSRRLVAAEMEICGAHSPVSDVMSTVRAWHGSVVHDGSLPSGGFEINLHPASGDFWLAQVYDVCNALQQNKCFVTNAAGCHTHVDAQDLGYLGLARLMRLVACTEAAMFCMIPHYRRNSSYCGFWAQNYLAHIHNADDVAKDATNERKKIVAYRRAILNPLYGSNKKDTVAGARRSKGNGNRYRATNVHSWFYRGTIEFRMPPGTIYPDNVINWGLMLANLVDLAAYRTHDEIVALTGEMEQHIKKTNRYSVPWNELDTKTKEMSVALLKSLSPTEVVRDWVTERIKWANKLGTGALNESY